MEHSLNTPFLTPSGSSPALPLGRFLPDCPEGVIAAWLQKEAPAGSWVLDPFGSTPGTSIQAAKTGYRVLAAVNNPLLAFELQMLCQLPPRSEFQAALAELASSRRGDVRLETLIQSFYLTHCATCGREIQASSFIWKRGEKSPYARTYTCPFCGDEGIHPATDADAERLAPLLRAEPLHRARALEKAIAPDMDEDEKHNVEEALKNYPVRALVVLFNLLNKLDVLPVNSPNRKLLQALLLPVLDAGTSLWPWPESSETPHLLFIPAEYVERNLWQELESAVNAWQNAASAIELTQWPSLPNGAGICLFPGRVKEFHSENYEIDFSGVVCNLPRPSQAFWTLSALWSAWVWGKEASAGYASVLGRRRFDWHWHARALHSTLDAVDHIAKGKTPVFGLIANAVPGFILAATSAASAASFSITGLASKSDREEVQFHWATTGQSRSASQGNFQEIIRKTIRQTLMEYGQPASYLAPFVSALGALAQNHLLPDSDEKLTPERLGEIQTALTNLFLDRSFLRHYDSNAQEIEPGSWYLENPENCLEPLDDRVETEIVKLLLGTEALSLEQIQEKVNSALAGVTTPDDQILQVCLESYADRDPTDLLWRMKSSEKPAERKAELKEMRRLLQSTAARIGAVCEGDQPITWKFNDENAIAYRFFLGASGIFQPHVCQPAVEEVQSVYVFPASRVALIQYKLNHNPRLREMVSANWHFLKFRYLQALAQRTELDSKLWSMLLDGDPLSSEKDTQLSIFL